MLTLAHVSDTHFGGPTEASSRAHAVMDHLLEVRPDALVVTGDVADHGLAEEYAEARAWLDRWPGPSLVVPGNHDVREAFVETFGSATPTLDLDAARVVGLDSLVSAVDGRRIDHGELDLTGVDERLADPRPTYLALHHPPVDLGQPLMVDILLREPERLAEVVARHDHVVALLVGHCHTACATTYAGVPVLVGGGVASTVPIEHEPLPRVWEAAPPSFALHRLGDDGRLTTHWRSL